MANEFAFIDWIRQRVHTGSGTVVGIGDDCAVLKASSQSQLLVGKDVLLEGTHFEFPAATPELAGRKALAVNLSDIAAMGGRPTSAFVGLALTAAGGLQLAERVMSGIQELAEQFDVTIAGGDTNIWNGPLVISVTILGETTGHGPVLRSGARPGDWLFVTGPLGGSLENQRHLTFTPRIREAGIVQDAVPVHSMIDLSDGLSSDLRHIINASGAAAVIDAGRIPIHDDVPLHLSAEQRVQRALSDGEDFELLFTVSAENGQKLLAGLPEIPGLTKVGEIREGTGMVLRAADGTEVPLLPTGWEHRFSANS